MKQSFLKAAVLSAAMMLSAPGMAGNEPEIPEVNISGYDFMYVSGNSFVFYKISKREKLAFKIEKSEIFNYAIKSDKHSAFYTVCENGKLILKTVDFSAKKPAPQVITEWGLKCEEAITETYGTNSDLLVSKDQRYLGIEYEFSWDGYGFTKIKIYDTKEGKFIDTSDEGDGCFRCEYFMDNDESEGEEEETTIYSKFQNSMGEEDDHFSYFYKPDDNTSICLNDKLNLEGAGECYFHSLSPKQDRVVFSVVTGEGDFEHGPFCISSLDGKRQIVLQSTDMSVGSGIHGTWLSDGSFLYTTNFDEDENFKPAIMYIPAGSWTPVKLIDGSEFTALK